MAEPLSFTTWLSQIPLQLATRRILLLSISSIFAIWLLFLFTPPTSHMKITLPDVPIIKIDLHPNRPPPRPFNDSKVALLIEDRPIAHLAPLILHMISVVPPDWRFVFAGSAESIEFVNGSLPVQMQVRNGKLDLRELPGGFSVKGPEALSQTLTSLEFWRWVGGKDTWDWETPYVDGVGGRRPQVEWVLVFQTDSILCANSRVSLNEWLGYDWVGAPWWVVFSGAGCGAGLTVGRHIKDPYGGNGGLSLRRVSRIMQVLNFQNRRPNTLEMEDFWLIQRIGLLPGARMANTTTELRFSVEQVWYSEPMGYHMGWSGKRLPEGVWGDPRQREQIWRWCPEIKLILDMRLERECWGGEMGEYKVKTKRMMEGEVNWPRLSQW